MLTELFELIFRDFNDRDILVLLSAWHFHHLLRTYLAEDIVLTTTLHAIQLFTEMGLTLMMRFGKSQCPNMSSPSLLEFGTAATIQKQIEAKNSWYLYFSGRLLALIYLS